MQSDRCEYFLDKEFTMSKTKQPSPDLVEKYFDLLEREEVLTEAEEKQLTEIIEALELRPVDLFFHREMLRRTALVTLRRGPGGGVQFLNARDAAKWDFDCVTGTRPEKYRGRKLPYGFVEYQGSIVTIGYMLNREAEKRLREAEANDS
jgi:hypothetical protein